MRYVEKSEMTRLTVEMLQQVTIDCMSKARLGGVPEILRQDVERARPYAVCVREGKSTCYALNPDVSQNSPAAAETVDKRLIQLSCNPYDGDQAAAMHIASETMGDLRKGYASYPFFSIPVEKKDDIAEFLAIIQKHFTGTGTGFDKDGVQGGGTLPGPSGDELVFALRWDCVQYLDALFGEERSNVGDQFAAWLRARKETVLPEGVDVPASCLAPIGFDLASRTFQEWYVPKAGWVFVNNVINHKTGETGYWYEDATGVFRAETKSRKTAEEALIEMCGWSCASVNKRSACLIPFPTPIRTISRHPREFIPLELQQPPEWLLRDYVKDENGRWNLKAL